jgi:plasmid stability protein
MKALTIRNVDPRLARALAREQSRRKASLNQVVLELLRQALGVDAQVRRSNGLAKLAGTWTARELTEFDRNIKMFGRIDPEEWA